LKDFKDNNLYDDFTFLQDVLKKVDDSQRAHTIFKSTPQSTTLSIENNEVLDQKYEK